MSELLKNKKILRSPNFKEGHTKMFTNKVRTDFRHCVLLPMQSYPVATLVSYHTEDWHPLITPTSSGNKDPQEFCPGTTRSTSGQTADLPHYNTGHLTKGLLHCLPSGKYRVTLSGVL